MDVINDFFNEASNVISCIALNQNKLQGLSFWKKNILKRFNKLISEMCMIDEYVAKDTIQELVGAANGEEVVTKEIVSEFLEISKDKLAMFLHERTSISKTLFFRGSKMKGIPHDIYYIFKLKTKAVSTVDTSFGKYREAMLGKLYQMNSIEVRMSFARAEARKLDSCLAVLYESMSEYEDDGYIFKSLNCDIGDFASEIVQAFSYFDIDFISLLKNNSDFEKEYGNYNKWLIPIEMPQVVETQTEIKDNDKGYIDNEIKRLVPDYINQLQSKNLLGFLTTKITPDRINWLRDKDALVKTVRVWIKRGIFILPEGETESNFIIRNFTVKGKMIKIGPLRNSLSKHDNHV